MSTAMAAATARPRAGLCCPFLLIASRVAAFIMSLAFALCVVRTADAKLAPRSLHHFDSRKSDMYGKLKVLLGISLIAAAPAAFVQYTIDLTSVGNGVVANG